MESILAHFDADEFVDCIKQESYVDGVDFGKEQGIEQTTIEFYLSSDITKQRAIEKLNISEADFDIAIARYQATHNASK